MHHTLTLVLILLAAAVVVVALCRRLRLPPLVGYLAVGIAIGPNALGWVADGAGTRELGASHQLEHPADLLPGDDRGEAFAADRSQYLGGPARAVVANEVQWAFTRREAVDETAASCPGVRPVAAAAARMRSTVAKLVSVQYMRLNTWREPRRVSGPGVSVATNRPVSSPPLTTPNAKMPTPCSSQIGRMSRSPS